MARLRAPKGSESAGDSVTIHAADLPKPLEFCFKPQKPLPPAAQAVLDLIRQFGPLQQKEIVQRLDYGERTVQAITSDLRRRDLIEHRPGDGFFVPGSADGDERDMPRKRQCRNLAPMPRMQSGFAELTAVSCSARGPPRRS
jgi:hypothetical protein